jgi:hypothetical protein
MNIRPHLVALLPLALLAACPPIEEPPPDDPPPTGQCVVEANAPLQRGMDSAEPLALDTVVEGTLCPQRDNDGYRVTVAAPESVLVVTLSMTTNITPVEPVYSIFLDDGSDAPPAIGTGVDPLATSQGHITNFTAFHRVELAGDYVIVVADKEGFDDRFDNTNPYSLTVSVVPDPDVNEPNNTPAQASPLAAGTTEGLIATLGDDDWYAIEAPGNAQIIDLVITAPADSGIEHVATLLLNDELTVLQNEELSPGDVDGEVTAHIRQRVSGVAGTPFLLRIEDGGDDGDEDSNIDPALAGYTIELTILADPDVNEGALGNDSVDNATTVTDGATLEGALATFNDQDVYRITPPAGTTRANPGVLVVTVTFDGTLDEDFKPQVRALTADPEVAPVPSCGDGCEICYDGKCGEARLQRFIVTSPFRTALPLRNAEPVFVSVNEFNDDAFQDGGGYTISFAIEDDTDPGEVGDDFLIPNLEEAGYANAGELAQQRDESKQPERARLRPAGFLPVCDPATQVAGDPACLNVVPVAAPNDFFGDQTIDCSDPGAAPRSVNMTGRLTYEGDRDYFLVEDFPTLGYYGIEIDYSIDRTSPVELAIFVHGFNGNSLAGSTLEGAEETGGCSEAEGGQNACAPGNICVDQRCWTDGPANPGISDVFGDNECIVAFDGEGGRNISSPVYIEVVDNGINDFDLDMTYSLTVTFTCGCPASCDNTQDFCQDGP